MAVILPLVRSMTGADVDAVAELEAKTFSDPWSRSAFVEELGLTGRSYLVIEEHGEVVAYGGIMVIEDEAHVMTIAVEQGLRRHGLGSRLLLALIETAIEQGARHLTLEVRPSNEAARALYERFGFAAVGRRPRYYPDEDAIVMWAVDVPGVEYSKRLDRLREAL